MNFSYYHRCTFDLLIWFGTDLKCIIWVGVDSGFNHISDEFNCKYLQGMKNFSKTAATLLGSIAKIDSEYYPEVPP